MTSVTLLATPSMRFPMMSNKSSLQTLQGKTLANRSTATDDDTHQDIKANGFFKSSFRKFFDANVLNPYAKSSTIKHTRFLQISGVHQEAEIQAKDNRSRESQLSVNLFIYRRSRSVSIKSHTEVGFQDQP